MKEKRNKSVENKVQSFERYLRQEERSAATVEKYMRDVRSFFAFANGQTISKTLTVRYKEYLKEHYAITSANSMIASLNAFLRFAELDQCCVKQFKVQRQIYCPEEKELTKSEYIRLVNAAKSSGNERLSLVIETICSTGIRVSELKYITAESLHNGKAVINCKGKTRTVFLPVLLQKKLRQYIKKYRVQTGAVFITKSGKPLNRSNIWREMKLLCERADVNPSKVFPHNLRHLFARVFYGIEKDIVKLADILGHSSINTTRIYIISTGAEHRRKIEQMRLIV